MHESEIVERRGCQAGLIPLVADQDDAAIEHAAELGGTMPGRRIHSPLEHVAGEEQRAGDHPIALSLALRADVDQHGAVADGGGGFTGLDPIESPASGFQ